VLVVEDNQVNQMVAEGVLTALGYAVDLAWNGVEALALLERTRYDAILMDCHMPVMDGFAATVQIRHRQSGGERTPIIAMTAGVLAQDRERCVAAGMDDFVPKPVDADLLATTLDRWIDRDGAPPDPVPAAPASGDTPVLDGDRIQMLRGIGAPDGLGLLPSLSVGFVQDGATRLAAMRSATGSDRGHVLAEAAHSLRGSAATVGAVRVAQLCADLEAVALTGTAADASRVDALLDRLAVELAAAGSALDGMLSTTR